MSWPPKKRRKLRWRRARRAWVLLTSRGCDARPGPLPQHDDLRLRPLGGLSESAAAGGVLVMRDDEAVVAADERPPLARAARGLEEEEADGDLRLALRGERDAVAADPDREVVALAVDLDVLRARALRRDFEDEQPRRHAAERRLALGRQHGAGEHGLQRRRVVEELRHPPRGDVAGDLARVLVVAPPRRP